MGCSHSRFDEDEAVQICKDRKRFIKQAVEHRTRFASGHIAYIQSLRKVSDALREYIEGDEPHEFSLDTLVTPVKRRSSSGGFIELSPSSKMIQRKLEPELEVNYLMASGSRPVLVEEKPPTSPETFHVETYGADTFFGMNMNPVSSPVHNMPPPSPQSSQWDFFWNPFSSVDHYGYGYDNRSGMDDDEMRRLRQVREQEGIPDLEEDVRFEEHSMKATEDCNGECHQIQKRTLDEAKLLLATKPSNKKQQQTSLPEINSQRLARSALNLVAQLRSWRACFQAWITSQRSYVLSLTRATSGANRDVNSSVLNFSFHLFIFFSLG